MFSVRSNKCEVARSTNRFARNPIPKPISSPEWEWFQYPSSTWTVACGDQNSDGITLPRKTTGDQTWQWKLLHLQNVANEQFQVSFAACILTFARAAEFPVKTSIDGGFPVARFDYRTSNSKHIIHLAFQIRRVPCKLPVPTRTWTSWTQPVGVPLNEPLTSLTYITPSKWQQDHQKSLSIVVHHLESH